MNKSFAPLVLAAMMTACATTPPPEEKDAGSGKMGVVQTGTKQNAEYVFCETNRCPARTPKVLPLPPVEPKKSTVAAAAPVQSVIHFKVHFLWGWSRLDKDARQEVEEVVASSHFKNAKQIVVAGRTDPTGSKKFNERLALRRAQTVKAALVLAGVPAEVITAEAQAPCCGGNKGAAPAVMRELRRTDIDITITTK